MKNLIRVSIILAFVMPFSIMAQTLGKKNISKRPYQIHRNFTKGRTAPPVLYPSKMPKSHFAVKANYRNAQADEPMRFPHQNPAGSYFSSCPISLGNGQVLMVWINPFPGDTVYCAPSSDAGLSWGNPILVATTSFASNPTGVRTNTGRVIVVWGTGEGLRANFSDNNGANWCTTISVTSDGGDFAPTVTQTVDGKLWLVYNRFDPSASVDIYFRTSADNGASWSAERAFLATAAVELDGAVVSSNDSTLYAVYNDNSSGGFDIYQRTSTDGGNTWSAPSPLVNSPRDEFTPRVLRQPVDTLWVTYEVVEPNTIPGYFQSDIYYTKSIDEGNTWSAPAKFTRYAGFDGAHNTALVNDQPFVSFASYRWAPSIFQAQIWYGLIGTTTDDNPPPTLLNAFAFATQQDFANTQSFVDDETGIADVKISYTLNDIPNGPLQMYDDGQHNDGSASDNIWGAVYGSLQLGNLIFPTFSTADISSNNLDISSFPLKIKAAHNAGNVILSFDDNSQLAEAGAAPGTSAYWPAVNGQDYLYLGGLWVGANVAGENRVMNLDYFEFDWNRTPGTPYTLAPGVSDQDGSVTYDDTSTTFSSPIGLQVHQQSYQWSAPARNDFIVFKYTVRNLGTNGNLSNMFVSPWLDPDVTIQGGFDEAFDDQVGYDSQRRMIYIYDSQNDPRGYLGLKLLGAGKTPHTVHAYPIEQDPFDDDSRYQYMTNGNITIPPESGDRRLLLTAQSFSLVAGDSATVAYGIVMGIDLRELQAHADTLDAIYGGLLTGVAEARSDQIPTRYSLAQNYPNPFNPSTKILFSLPRAQAVSLKVFDLAGNEVATLINQERKPAGHHEIVFDAGSLANGVYLYRLQAGDFSETKKMLVVK